MWKSSLTVILSRKNSLGRCIHIWEESHFWVSIKGPFHRSLKMQNGSIPLSASYRQVLPGLMKCQHFLLHPEFSRLQNSTVKICSRLKWSSHAPRLLGTYSWILVEKCFLVLVLLILRKLVTNPCLIMLWTLTISRTNWLWPLKRLFDLFFRKTVENWWSQ